MRRLLLFAAMLAPICAQSFEVVSIREVDPMKLDPTVRDHVDASQLFYRNTDLKYLIMKAFGVTNYQCEVPEAVQRRIFEIKAKLPEGSTVDDISAMLQHLLVERFGLKWHFEDRTEKGYALVVGKSGPKLKQSEVAAPQRDTFIASWGHFDMPAMTMERLAAGLSSWLRKPVVDGTGLNGEYDIVMDYDLTDLPGHAGFATHDPDDPPQPTLEMALERLGLRLEPRRITLTHLIVDHVEPLPTGN